MLSKVSLSIKYLDDFIERQCFKYKSSISFFFLLFLKNHTNTSSWWCTAGGGATILRATGSSYLRLCGSSVAIDSDLINFLSFFKNSIYDSTICWTHTVCSVPWIYFTYKVFFDHDNNLMSLFPFLQIRKQVQKGRIICHRSLVFQLWVIKLI